MQAAAVADRSVRPLLTYYGILSLSRALILFISTNLREAGLAQSHGLSIEGWGQALSKDNMGVATLRLENNSHGTFQQLLDATGHCSFIRFNSSVPNHVHTCPMPQPNTKFSMGEIFARIPEIREVHRRLQDERCMVEIWPQGHNSDGSITVRVDPPYTIDDVEAVFGNSPV